MTLYAESSAVLAWLLDEEAGAFVRQTLSETLVVLASDLTLVECDPSRIGARGTISRRRTRASEPR